MTPEEYKKLNEKVSPPTNSPRNLTLAFLIGGAICALGQGLQQLYADVGLEGAAASTGTGFDRAATLIFVLLSALLSSFFPRCLRASAFTTTLRSWAAAARWCP